MGIIITNGRIVSSEGILEKDIRIVGEKIVEIGLNISKAGDEIIDAKGSYVMPGAIDVHTHFDADACGIVADSFYTGTKAAISGGTTTIIDFSEQVKGGTLREALNQWNEKTKDNTYTDYGYHMTISDWNKETEKEMEDMVKEGITSFKMFLAYKDLQVDDGAIYEALKKSKELGALISFHCENGYIIDKLREEAILNGNIEPIFHMETRPSALEREAISRLISIGEVVNTPVYIVHLSSKEGYEEIQRAKERGQKVLVETCPQYLLLNKDYYLPKGQDPFEGAKYVMSPPLRDIESNKVLWKGLSLGEIDVVATDHCAFNYKVQKELGIDDFTKIPNGAPGVENRFKLIYTYGVREEKITMEKLVEVLSENPAKIFGLYPKKGVIKEGSDADIVIFNPEYKSIIKAEEQIQNVDYNLYEGFTQYGRFEYIFLRGQIIVEKEKIINSTPTGKYQRRSKPKFHNN
jgi:dihydropyrimidinase